MTTVAELKKFLDQFPEDANVEVVAGEVGRDYTGDSFRTVDFVCENVTRSTPGTFWDDNAMWPVTALRWASGKTFEFDGKNLTLGVGR